MAEDSSFFNLLSTSPYEALFKQWTDQQAIILIPPEHEVQYVIKRANFGTTQMMAFVKSHILKESAFFLGQYTSETDKSLMEVVETDRKAPLSTLFRKTSSGNLLSGNDDKKSLEIFKDIKR